MCSPQRSYQLSVHNYSSINIPTSVRKYLGFGTKFVPKPKANPRLILPSVEDFTRRIRIKEIFKDTRDNPDFDIRFHVKTSTWKPNPSSNTLIEKGLRLVKSNVMPLNHPTHYQVYNNRLNDIVPKFFKDFINNPDILIKASDKNLGLTVLDTSWYIQEGLRQLNDPRFYKQLDKNFFSPENFDSNIQNIVSTANSLLSLLCSQWGTSIFNKQHEKYLRHRLLNDRKLPTFHLLPKIHKTPMQGRPIVPSHSWVTTGFSTYIDTVLQKVLPHLPYIIKDTKSLVKSLDGISIPQDERLLWLVTGDVSSMYTNLPTTPYAFDVIAKTVDKYLPLSPNDTTLIRETLKFVMSNNYFTFQGIPYHQVSGIAMGTACAPAYANILMHHFEERFFEFNPDFTLIFYGRYIDDIFFMFKGSEQELKTFLTTFDTKRAFSNQLKISWDYSTTSVSFLDLQIHAKHNKVELSTHQKMLNKYLYIPFSSYHPKDNKVGFIKAELIRYIRNSSSYRSFANTAKQFFTRLRLRGYPPRFLIWVFSQVRYDDRPKYLEDAPLSTDNTLVPFVTMYNPIWETPHLRKGLREFFTLNPHYRPVVAFKRNKNIADLLNRANVRKLTGKQFHSLQQDGLCWISSKKRKP
ncbi:uncharacterized protein ATC70_010256 [Mucor velutinosus]|uniref:Rho-type GTPase activating protein Rga1 n=2 Tax=Mucor velutinosus TaxID=708070 RepID=A0AAN7DBZ7_9FUNG|nr:hypothetical protein ATC70_003774 [Mucor velutinosus]KAK4513307.1 hypothetical protein ATC70_011875 [Mucor velutinosus]KAK4514149.1 Rho-type GTPase activating protein Rga1 [Mucor velutinosus]KAK4515312.1 hypothetical protein ATC70_010256 [Mucor velutinosus]